MDVDSSDILGGRLPLSSPHSGGIWAPITFSQFSSFVAVAALAAWIVVQHAIPWNRKRQETLYRKSMRRRHGIPDSDHRPFNVAYAAAMQARKEREAGGRHRRGVAQGPASINTASQTHLPPSQPLRQRTSYIEHTATQPFTFLDTTGDGASLARTDLERAGNHTANRVANTRGKRARSSSQASSAALEPTRAKHRLDEEIDLEDGNEPKKSRVHESDPIDIDSYSSHEETDEGMDIDMTDQGVVHPKRGFKRSTSHDDDEGIAMAQSHPRGKKARKVSRNKSKEVLDQAKEEADDIADLESIPRGKKRDRMEAGSTFGGDESFLEDEEEKPRSHRRRRTASHRKTSAAARGQKRGREVIDAMESDEGSELSSKRSARQKRGRKGSEDGYLSLDDGMISHDPLCKGRRIGEEWESNGVIYKVGPNGQRLRQALVKKARSLFPMPKDSHHPDRDANVQVFVETWLSDEEYQQAKVNHELAWQESPPYPGSPTTSVVLGSPTVGKSLLWSSTSVPKDSPRRGPLRQSIVSNSGLRINPFQQSLVASGRRISTSHSPVVVSPDSPQPRIKSYSKWEKQDLEAAAMAKLREKAQKQAEAQKKSAAPVGTPTPSVPPVSAPPAAVKSETPAPTVETKLPTPSSFAAPPVPSASTGQSSTAVPAFSFPSTPSISKPAESVKPSSLAFPTVATASSPAAPNKPSPGPSAPSFSFAQPSTAQVPAPLASTQSFFNPPADSAPKVNSAQPTSAFFPKSAVPSTAPPAFSFAPSAPAPASSGPQNTTIPTITVTRAPSDTSTPAASQPPVQKPELSWGNPPANVAPAPNPPAPKPLFSFGPSSVSAAPPPFQSKPAEEAPPTAPSSGGPSLASRIGGLATPTSPGTAPQFQFAKPEVPAFSSSNPQPQASTTAAPPAQPKFNFGFASKPSSSSSPLAPTSATPSGEALKPTPAAFGFPAPQPPTGSPFAPTNSTPSGAGTSGTTSGSAFATPKDPASAPKSTFSWPSANASPSPFSTTPASSPAGGSIFGNTTTPGPNSSFGFGASTTTPSGAPPSIFGGTSTAPASSSAPTAVSNSFATPGTPAKTNETPSKPVFSFNFGTQNSSSSTPAFGAAGATNGATNGSPAPAFGSAQPSGGFSFGSSSGTFKFGAANTGSNQQQK